MALLDEITAFCDEMAIGSDAFGILTVGNAGLVDDLISGENPSGKACLDIRQFMRKALANKNKSKIPPKVLQAMRPRYVDRHAARQYKPTVASGAPDIVAHADMMRRGSEMLLAAMIHERPSIIDAMGLMR